MYEHSVVYEWRYFIIILLSTVLTKTEATLKLSFPVVEPVFGADNFLGL